MTNLRVRPSTTRRRRPRHRRDARERRLATMSASSVRQSRPRARPRAAASADREACLVILTGTADVEAGGETFRRRRRPRLACSRTRRRARSMPRPASAVDRHGDDRRRGWRSAPRPAQAPARPALIAPDRDEPRDARDRDQHALRAQHPARDRAGREPAGGRGRSPPRGHWSSYPPHKHDTDTPDRGDGAGGDLLPPPQPAAGLRLPARLHRRPQPRSRPSAVEDGDVVLVPRGYHPVGAPHGYDLYYLNVMAGPKRQWIFRNDPAHDWIVAAK